MSSFAPSPGMYNWRPPFRGLLSSFGPLLSSPFIWDSARLFLFGSMIESGRRIFQWALRRFRLQFFISAQFHSGDAAFEWLVSFLTKEIVARETRDFHVESRTSKRKWLVEPTGHAYYIPRWGSPTLSHWKGHWLDYEVTITKDGSSTLHLTIYTRDKSVLVALVEECRLKYIENSKPYVTIYSTESDRFNGGVFWDSVKNKRRRPLESLVLGEGVVDTLLADARDFLEKEDWYTNAGIPHRRGYLLYGPPGTGKTTTVCAMAAELELEIYSLSLASSNIDDVFLSRAVSFLPPHAILLIEDIDCAFPPRDDEEEDDEDADQFSPQRPWKRGRRYDPRRRSQVTLSGLLNVLDGVGSEEGKIFFATTNHIDYLDPALLRPGRIDRKIQYKLSNREQAHALFTRFFPAERFDDLSKTTVGEDYGMDCVPKISELADDFAQEVPENEFSTAELQGYLLEWKHDPIQAVRAVEEWVANEREMREDRRDREKRRRDRAETARARKKVQANEAVIMGIGKALAEGQRPSRHHHHHIHPISTSDSSAEENGLMEVDQGASSSRAESGEGLPTVGPKLTVNGTSDSPPGSSSSRTNVEA